MDIGRAAKLVRGYAERGDAMALEIFRQQAMAIGRVFSIAAKFTDPDTYFVGGGVIEAAPHFRDWFLAPGEGEHGPLRRAGGDRGNHPGPRPGHGRCPRFRHRRRRLGKEPVKKIRSRLCGTAVAPAASQTV